MTKAARSLAHPPLALLPALALAAGLVACDKPKPRDPPPPLEAAYAPAPKTAPGASQGLAKRPEMAGFSLDAINGAPDPVNRPATIQSGATLVLTGFAFDPVTKAPAKAVDIVLDGTAHATTYGHARQDVADYTKVPALSATGFTVSLPAALNTPGPHKVLVRAVAADGGSYFDGVEISFYAK